MGKLKTLIKSVVFPLVYDDVFFVGRGFHSKLLRPFFTRSLVSTTRTRIRFESGKCLICYLILSLILLIISQELASPLLYNISNLQFNRQHTPPKRIGTFNMQHLLTTILVLLPLAAASPFLPRQARNATTQLTFTGAGASFSITAPVDGSTFQLGESTTPP